MTVTVTTESPDEVSVAATSGTWLAGADPLTLPRLRSTARDRRFAATWHCAWHNDRLAAVLPSYRLRQNNPSQGHDPAQLMPWLSAEPGDWRFLGGCRDYVSGITIRPDCPDPGAVRALLVRIAARAALEAGETPVALYLHPGELPAFTVNEDGLVSRGSKVAETAVLEVPTGGPDGYLASLGSKRRPTVQKEWRRLDAAGLRARLMSLSEAIGPGSVLVAETNRRHGVPDHPRLAALRIAEWAAGGPDEAVAFVIGEDPARPAAVSFAARGREAVSLYEGGVRADHPDRHLAYTEVLVYAPLRWAWQLGAERIDLGLHSAEPKRIRGAGIHPVWALSFARQDLQELPDGPADRGAIVAAEHHRGPADLG